MIATLISNYQITCLYDMDIVFQPTGNFDEVYLYEELMEADLHAIVSARRCPFDHNSRHQSSRSAPANH
jgi:hypothetical protein